MAEDLPCAVLCSTMQQDRGDNGRDAIVLRKLAIFHLTSSCLPPHLTYRLCEQRKALHITFCGVATAGIDWQFASQFDPASLYPVAAFATLAKPEALESE